MHNWMLKSDNNGQCYLLCRYCAYIGFQITYRIQHDDVIDSTYPYKLWKLEYVGKRGKICNYRSPHGAYGAYANLDDAIKIAESIMDGHYYHKGPSKEAMNSIFEDFAANHSIPKEHDGFEVNDVFNSKDADFICYNGRPFEIVRELCEDDGWSSEALPAYRIRFTDNGKEINALPDEIRKDFCN